MKQEEFFSFVFTSGSKALFIMKRLNNNIIKGHLDRGIRNRLTMLCTSLTESLKDDFIRSFINNCIITEYEKHEAIDQQDIKYKNHLHLILSGNAYTQDREETELAVREICMKDHIIFDLNAYMHGKSVTENIHILENSRIISISYDNLKVIVGEYPEMDSILFCLQAERELECKFWTGLLKLTLENKVALLNKRHPTMRLKIPEKIIASRMGVSRSRYSSTATKYML